MSKQIWLVAALALVACGKKNASKDNAKGSAAPKGPAASVDPGPANAKIPAAWKGKLEFVSEQVKDMDDTVTAVVPKGWTKKSVGLEPPDGSSFGFGAKFWVGKDCDGECKAKSAAEWEKSASNSFFNNLMAHTPPPKVLKDDKQPGHRTLIAEDQYTDGQVNNTEIMMAWWKDGADHYYFCNATLPPESKDLVDAFEQACAHLDASF